MLIEEIIRSCANEQVACAAVASIGSRFANEVRDGAKAYGMSVGAFTALSVERFARHGDEAEMRSVLTAMNKSQEPILAGLHRILCIMLAAGAGGPTAQVRARERMPRIRAMLCMRDVSARRDHFG